VAGSDQFIVASQYSLYTGRSIVLSTTGTAPGGLVAGNTYYIIRDSDTVFELASSYANALTATQINITTQGTGTHTFTANAFTAHTLGQSIGEADHFQLIAEMASHDHNLAIGTVPLSGTGSACLPSTSLDSNPASTANLVFNTGGGQQMPIQSPAIVKNKCIRF
jgi:tripartite-type tricarboxylate transporter receptor subunit TctC